MVQPKSWSQVGLRDEHDGRKVQTYASPAKTNIKSAAMTSSSLPTDMSPNNVTGDGQDKLRTVTNGRPEMNYGVTFLSQGELEAGNKQVQLVGLDMRQNGLCILSLELFRFNSLSILLLSNNYLTQIPAEIAQLRDLQVMDLSSNKLASLPKEIGRLVKLRELYLNNNTLKTLPVQLGRLVQLRALSLEGNPWKEDLHMLVDRQATVQEIVMHLRNSTSKFWNLSMGFAI
jgi:Leucine-rich repeat (LRR) protein